MWGSSSQRRLRCVVPNPASLDLPQGKQDVDHQDARMIATSTQPANLPCPHCRGTMSLVRHLDLDGVPAIYLFYCSRCHHVETVKQERERAA
jgi:hypothetical protein